jgi:hypothetical protein
MKRKSFKKDKKTVNARTVPVLYQNIGGEVYAFAQVGTEVYFGKVPVRSSPKEALAIISGGVEKDAA